MTIKGNNFKFPSVFLDPSFEYLSSSDNTIIKNERKSIETKY
jgi:hypothetical protein